MTFQNTPLGKWCTGNAMGKGYVLCALKEIGTDKPLTYEVGWCDNLHGNWHFTNVGEWRSVVAWMPIAEYQR